jgi:hypothetical protein
MSNNPDRNKKNSVHSSVHTLKDTWDLDARGLLDCVKGSWRLKPCKKISKICLSWMKKTLDLSF